MRLGTHDLLVLSWTHLWQLSFCVLVADLLTRTVLKEQPRWAYRVWDLVLAKSLTPPLVTSPTGLFSWFQLQVHDVAAGPEPWLHQLNAGAARLSQTALGQGLYLAWCVGAGVTLVLAIAQGWLFWRRLPVSGEASHASLPHRLQSLQQRLKLTTPVKLMVTSQNVGPAIVGWRSTTLILPEVILASKSPPEIDIILAHELMHVRRGDTLIVALQLVAKVLWWFFPPMWWANQQLSRWCEECCDRDVVAELRVAPRTYADCLLGVLETKCSLRPVVGAAGVFQSQVTFGRLASLLRCPADELRGRSRFGLMAMLLASLLVLPGGALRVSAESLEPLRTKNRGIPRPCDATRRPGTEAGEVRDSEALTIPVDVLDQLLRDDPQKGPARQAGE